MFLCSHSLLKYRMYMLTIDSVAAWLTTLFFSPQKAISLYAGRLHKGCSSRSIIVQM